MNPTKEKPAMTVDTLAGEVLFLGLFGKMIYTYPASDNASIEWFQYIMDEDLFSDPPFAKDQPNIQHGMQLLKDWVNSKRGLPIKDTISELQVDHTRLFVCVGEIIAPPWESAYFNEKRLLQQEQMLQVRKWYRRYGLVVEQLYKEPDDHIGLELLFISYLANQILQAQDSGDDDRYAVLLNAHHAFLKEHLLLWGPLWCDQVDKYAQTNYYRGIGLAVKGALAELAEVSGFVNN